MAEEGGLTIAQRMAALKLNQVGRTPGDPPPPYSQTMSVAPAGTNKRPPPPPPPTGGPRPPVNGRTQSSNNPPVRSHVPVNGNGIGNIPDDGKFNGTNGTNGTARPPLPSRPSQSPALPPRRTSEQTPALPPRRPSEAPSASSRRPSEFALSRKGSNESMSSVVSSRSSISAMSTGTSRTSASQGDRFTIRAPTFDPSSLPPLPPKRPKEEKEAPRQPLKATYSSTNTLRKDEPMPAPRDRLSIQSPPPALPGRRAPSQEPPPTRAEQLPAQPPRRSALSWGLNNATQAPPPLPGGRPNLTEASSSGHGATTPITGRYGTLIVPDSMNELDSHLSSSSDSCTILYFTLPTCPPCKLWAGPKTESLAAQYPQALFVKVDLHGLCARVASRFLEGTSYRTPTWVALVKGAKVDQWTDQMMADTGLLTSKVDGLMKNHGQPIAPSTNGASPPVPRSSRPDVSAIMASKPKPGATPSLKTNSCLRCRDFSGPDGHAARFPRQSLASQDIGWLAHQLCDPFPSLTDKARALFTWQHHNIAYNVEDFFSGNLKPSTPASTIATGKAVCEGYAALFSAMAVKIGLEAVTISGNGKGFGHTELKPGDPIPPLKAGHAWNAVKIDNGEWKLIDACWGAGTVSGAGQPFKKGFAPERFTQSNEDFGLSHFPMDDKYLFRSDGRIISWEEYILLPKNGNGPFVFNGFVSEEGVDGTSFAPRSPKIQLSQQGPATRFTFQKVCSHWDPMRCGRGPWYLYVLHAEGLDGTQNNHIPFNQTPDGVWYLDVPTKDLGRPGQKVNIYTVTKYDGADGRGLTKDAYLRKKGRVGMAFGGVCTWTTA